MLSCRCSRSIALEAGGGGAAAGGAVGVGRSVRGGGGASAVEERADEDADGLDATLAGFSAQGSSSRLAGSQVHVADQQGVPSDEAMTVVLRQAQPLSHASDATHNLHHREAFLGIVLCTEALELPAKARLREEPGDTAQAQSWTAFHRRLHRV